MVKTSFRKLTSCNMVGEEKFDLEIIKMREMQQKRIMICFSGFLRGFSSIGEQYQFP